MVSRCPDCDTPIYGNKCKCGWKGKDQPKKLDRSEYVETNRGQLVRRCFHYEGSERCDQPGTMARTVRADSETPIFCWKHYSERGI